MAAGASTVRKRAETRPRKRPLAAAPIWSAAASLPTDPPHSTVSAVPTMIAGASSGGTERPSRTASITRAVLQEKSRPTARYAP